MPDFQRYSGVFTELILFLVNNAKNVHIQKHQTCNLTSICPSRSMYIFDMFLQIRASRRQVTTLLTFIWFVSSVNSNVIHNMTSRVRFIGALIAYILVSKQVGAWHIMTNLTVSSNLQNVRRENITAVSA